MIFYKILAVMIIIFILLFSMFLFQKEREFREIKDCLIPIAEDICNNNNNAIFDSIYYNLDGYDFKCRLNIHSKSTEEFLLTKEEVRSCLE